ncbi:hypothetical protein F4779DRAFT_468936 [Xylariaceae sp. FL0662B]|nr:hypothetical protein F4779DRAFT_468936 [Xylariaceae sp. FL0662B]
MLSSIGRAATKRLASAASCTSSGRIVVTRLGASASVQQLVILKSGYSSVRGFATRASQTTSAATGRAKKPTATAKKPAKKPAKTTAKKTAKKPAKKSAKKVTATKASKPKKTRVKSPEAQSILERRELKRAALFSEPKNLGESAWAVFVAERTQGQPRNQQTTMYDSMKELSKNFKELPAADLQRLESVAEGNKRTNAAAYKKWVESHTPEEVSRAINARRMLKKKFNYPVGQLKLIRDDRLPKKPATSFVLFTKARWASGDFAKTPVTQASKTIGQEWLKLPAEERHAYEDLSKSNLERYEKDVASTLNRAVRRHVSP